MKWNTRSNFNHNFFCVFATIFLIIGHGNISEAGSTTEPPPSNSTGKSTVNSTASPSSSTTVSSGPSTPGTVSTTPLPTTVTTTVTSTEKPRAEPPGLTIHFVGDLQYDIFPVYQNGTICSYEEAADKCVGGLARLKSYMNKTLAKNSKSIWLNTGNTLGGELFKTLKFDTAQRAMNLLNFTATAIEANVFSYGADAGLRYINGSKSAVVSNMEPKQTKSVSFPVDNCTVSIIGFLDGLRLTEKVDGINVTNYTQSIITEIEALKKGKNVSNLVTVVIGATNRTNAEALAKIKGIDLVLFSGDWSVVDKQDFWVNGNETTAAIGSVKVNHTNMAGRFLVGEINLPFTDGCKVKNTNLSVVNYFNETSDESALVFVKAELKRLNGTLTKNNRNLTGEKDLCGHKECSLGNLITDAMVAALQSDIWNSSDTTIALFPAIHLNPNKTIKQGPLVMTDLNDVIDKDMYISSFLLTGKKLWELLEISVNCSVNTMSTDFFHISELLHVEYREKMENNSRIHAIKTVNSTSMLLNRIDNAASYNVSFPSCFLNMDAYKKTLEGVKSYNHSVTVIEAVTNFINNTGYLHLPAIGFRYVMLDPIIPPHEPPPCEKHTGTTVIVTLVLAALIIAGLYFGWRYIIRRYRPRSGSTLHMISLD